MNDFAKLFEFDETGQALFTLCDGDEGPEIAIRISSIKGLAPEIKMSGYGDDADGWSKADEAFKSIDESRALELALTVKKTVYDMINKASGASSSMAEAE